MVFVSSFHPRGGVFCCSWRDGAVLFFFRGGTGRFFFPRRDGAGFFFSEAGRGVFFFPRRGWHFFFSTGRDGAVFFLFFRGPGRDGCFWWWQFFWRDGAKSLHRPAKGGLNRPASRPCKALIFCKNGCFRQWMLNSRIEGASYGMSLNKRENRPAILCSQFSCCMQQVVVTSLSCTKTHPFLWLWRSLRTNHLLICYYSNDILPTISHHNDNVSAVRSQSKSNTERKGSYASSIEPSNSTPVRACNNVSFVPQSEIYWTGRA